ncbi:DNA methyltransferase [Clostridium thermarum]|uniref:DNA methyltransferase n=1 Tax=Clostridium thermarum TaxID=1716543 RepID=UPI00112188A6|nr:DNA methyltransferase [Clostridium thermarum]
MANLSQEKRQRMLNFLTIIKEEHKDNDEALKAIYEIENELVSKKYGLVWEEHEENVDIQMRENIPVFTEIKDKEIIGDINNPNFNFLLEGDNLHSLKLLEKTHRGKIDVIYIDPPYNTGNKDFVYNDDFVGTDDTFRHSKWLSFIEKRLRIAYRLLSENGLIFCCFSHYCAGIFPRYHSVRISNCYREVGSASGILF